MFTAPQQQTANPHTQGFQHHMPWRCIFCLASNSLGYFPWKCKILHSSLSKKKKKKSTAPNISNSHTISHTRAFMVMTDPNTPTLEKARPKQTAAILASISWAHIMCQLLLNTLYACYFIYLSNLPIAVVTVITFLVQLSRPGSQRGQRASPRYRAPAWLERWTQIWV